MKKPYLILFALFICIVVLSNTTLAYLDPGTGGAIIGSLWPLIVIIFSTIGAFIVKWFWSPIKKVFSKITSTNKKNKEM